MSEDSKSPERQSPKRAGRKAGKKAVPAKKPDERASRASGEKVGEKAGDKAGDKPVELPSSGLADEILASLEDPSGGGGERPAEGPDRVYRFADDLGRRGAEEEETRETMETWVSFRLREEIFAFPVDHVQEVIRLESLTRVPHAPFPVRGITALRGQILPVVDLGRRLGMGETEIRPECRVLVISSRERTLGLLVERVEQVVRILPSRIEDPPSDALTEQSDYILGVYDLDPGLMILLDLDAVLVIRDPDKIEGRP